MSFRIFSSFIIFFSSFLILSFTVWWGRENKDKAIFQIFAPQRSPKTKKIKSLKNKFCSHSYKLGFCQFLWKTGKLVKRNKFFSDFFIFSIISLIAGVKFANIQIATKSHPCGVESWLSPFWNRHDEYFHMGENEENLRLFLRPPYPLKGLGSTLKKYSP